MQQIYEFGEFRLDEAERILARNGQTVALTPKVFDTLLIFVQNPGRLIGKDEFIKQLWPDTFVEEVALAQNISHLRKALGEVAGQVGFIQTVAKRGYRFVGHVRFAAVMDTLSQMGSMGSQSIRSAAAGYYESADRQQVSSLTRLNQHAKPWRIAALLAMGVLGILATGYFFFARRHSVGGNNARAIRSIVVLPLENLAHDPEQEFFADGMTDDLITELAGIGSVRVISRASAMRYKATKKSLPEIARELNVDAVIEGTVSHSPTRAHITAQLVQVSPEQHLWAASYDRPLGDVLALQEELAREIAGAIRATLTPQEQASLARARPPINPEAQLLYLKGHYFSNKRTYQSMTRAGELFRQAVDKDPTFAQAYVGLADCYVFLGSWGVMPATEMFPKAIAAAQTALRIDDSNAEAHASLGLIAMNYDWDWPEAERQYKLAIALNPNYARAHHWYAEYLAARGRFDEAMAEIHRAQDLDPLSLIINADLGKILHYSRQYDRAIQQLRNTLEMDPAFSQTNSWLAKAYEQKGMPAEAITLLERGQRFQDEPNVFLVDLGCAYARAGRLGEARRVMNEVEREKGSRLGYSSDMFQLYLAMGNIEQTFFWMEKSYGLHSSLFTSLKVNPEYDILRSDPRFKKFLDRVRLAD